MSCSGSSTPTRTVSSIPTRRPGFRSRRSCLSTTSPSAATDSPRARAPDLALAARLRAGSTVTRDQLAEYYRSNGGSPFNLVQSAGNMDQFRRRAVLDIYGQLPAQGQAEVLNKAIFAALDTDKDGKLSREELAAAATILMKKDADDDEMLTAAELRGEMPANPGYEVVLTRP